MGRKRTFSVKESKSELLKHRARQKTLKGVKRIEAILCLLDDEPRTYEEIGKHLQVDIRTLQRWIEEYKTEGIVSYSALPTRNKQSKIITPQLHQGLEERLNNASDPFASYVAAQQWVKEQYNIDIQYKWLRKYMIDNFGSKLKSPRKSHIRKDPAAVASFLKTS